VAQPFISEFGWAEGTVTASGPSDAAAQAEALKYAVEQWRKKKYQPVSGMIQYLFRDTPSTAGWGIVSASGEVKASYHALREANAPLHVFLDYDAEAARGVWVVNDYPQAYEYCQVAYCLRDAAGATVIAGTRTLHVPANAAVQVVEALDWQVGGPIRVELKLTGPDQETLDENCYTLTFPERQADQETGKLGNWETGKLGN
jgi:beta-mannosidase